MATLSIQLTGLPSVSHVLKDETVTIGRMKGNTIVIDDESVSLAHARITRKDGEFYLKDLNSTNGTRINGQPVNEVKLKDLDRISFAGITAQFLAEVALSASAPQPLAQPQPIVPPSPLVVPSMPPSAAKPATPQPVSFAKFIRSLAALAGGLAALALLSVALWKFLPMAHQAGEQSIPVASAMTLRPAQQPTVQERVKPAAPQVVAQPQAEPADKVETVAQLAVALKSSDVSERRRAVTALHSLGPEAGQAVNALRDALADTDSEVQVMAALTLVNNKYYDHATIPIFVRVLQHENPVMRQLACLSLALLPYEESEKQTVVPALTSAAAHDQDEEVRKAAVSALNVISPDGLAKASP